MADTDFTRFVPGFDFLQGLVKNAGAAIPGFNQWVAPTLNPQELDKRIDELRTVQFWLEQNARMLAATIQALEVQKMTLSTLHAMNVPMADLKEVLKTKMPQASEAPKAAPASPWQAKAAEDPLPNPPPQAGEGATDTSADADVDAGAKAKEEAKPAGADPMQWWNALTQQFTQVAANAMKTAQTAAAATSAATAAATSAATSAATAAAKSATSAATAAAKSAAAGASGATGARGKTSDGAKSAGKPARGATSRPATKAGTAKAPAKAAAKTASARKPAAKRKTSS